MKTTKPTGDAECPPEVDRAHEIDYMMNEKVSTRDLDDEEYADVMEDDDGHEDDDNDNDIIEISDGDSRGPTPPPSTQPRTSSRTSKLTNVKAERGTHSTRRATAVERAERAPRQSRATNAASWDALADSLNRSMDPTARAARDDERVARSIQNTQILTLTGDIRDLRAQLRDAERRASRAEVELAVARALIPTPSHPRRHHSPLSEQHRSRVAVRRERHYRDGGASNVWVTPSDEERESAQHPGQEFDPEVVYEHYHTPSRSQSFSPPDRTA